MRRPIISIVNSSTFGKHFSKHLEILETFAEIRHLSVPADIDPQELAFKLSGSNGIIASVTPKFPRETLERCGQLVLLVRHGIGCDNVDLRAASELGIMVSRVKGLVEKEAVAEYAVSLLLAVTRKIPLGVHAIKEDNWAARSGMIGMEIKGKTIGIIGLGNIGSRSAEILSKGFGAKIIATDPYIEKSRFAQFDANEVNLEELLQQSDIILFHCPLNRETNRMISKKQFSKMKHGAVLVNTCRGELLDEEALYVALNDGKLGAYATDVVEGEPIDGSHRLARLNNVLITPHLGGYSWESLSGMGETCVNDSIAVFQQSGIPGELANPEVLKTKTRKWHSL